ncbi:MAG: ABC-F family ATP-binding cassette domain-containing protein [Clostridia bacterium]|nr:ABC-F family ATP-binding cassette domain-containing protein [Clostridia bacterium]
MTVISVTELALRFGVSTVFEGVSFALDEHDKLGVIGVNGCGKSSLFKVIAGEDGYEASDGSVYISKDKTVGYLSQEGAFAVSGEDGSEDDSALEHMYHAFPELLALEARLTKLQAELDRGVEAVGAAEYERLGREYSLLNEKFIRDGGLEYRSRCASILLKLGFDTVLSDTPVKHLSGGQKTRLALAIKLSREPDILMLDEPTNHLDIETLAWLEKYLADYKGCVMVISHDRYFLDRVTNKTLCIENKHAKLYAGSYTQSMEQRKIDREIQEKHYRDQQKEIARQEAYIAQQRARNRERNIIAAESRQKLLDKMERVERPENAPKAIKLKFTASRSSGNEVLSLRSVKMGFGDRILFDGMSFLVKKNDRLLILGPNGCGKSTLIKLLIGQLEPLSGIIEVGYNVQIGYYDQENQNLDPNNTVLDELWNAYPKLTMTEIRNTLGQFRFVGEDVFKPVSVLSGGERARLTLAKLILSEMNLLILDEPTNHLDIDSREALEAALEGFDGTVIAVSHDRYFIEKLASRIIEIRPDKSGDEAVFDYQISHIGSAYTEYTDFMERREARVAAPTQMGIGTAQRSGGASKEEYLQAKASASELRKKQRRLERDRDEVISLEGELERVEADMNGDAATDYKRLCELDARHNEIEERLLELYGEIDELEAELG